MRKNCNLWVIILIGLPGQSRFGYLVMAGISPVIPATWNGWSLRPITRNPACFHRTDTAQSLTVVPSVPSTMWVLMFLVCICVFILWSVSDQSPNYLIMLGPWNRLIMKDCGLHLADHFIQRELQRLNQTKTPEAGQINHARQQLARMEQLGRRLAQGHLSTQLGGTRESK